MGEQGRTMIYRCIRTAIIGTCQECVLYGWQLKINMFMTWIFPRFFDAYMICKGPKTCSKSQRDVPDVYKLFRIDKQGRITKAKST